MVEIPNQCFKDVTIRSALPPDHSAYLSPDDLLFRRYVWLPPWMTNDDLQVHILAVNLACNNSGLLVEPEILEDGWLVAWDLRKLARDQADLLNKLIVWRSLGVKEPFFHAEVPKILGGAVACPPFEHIDGKTYHARRFVPAPHVAARYAELEVRLNCFAPLLRADDFLRRVMSTIEGGRYYHFAGFIIHGRRLTEAEIFAHVGLSVAVSRKVEGDDRAAMFMSSVTAKARVVEQLQGAVGRARITYDLFDDDDTVDRHPFYELLNFVERSRGKEIIYDKANGLFGFILTDGKGNLVDVGPQELVTDNQVPAPHTANLFPPLSCLRCHAPNGGVQAVRNEVPALFSGGPGEVDFFDDLSSGLTREEIVNRVAGLYAAGDEFQADLEESRNTFADAVFRITGGMNATAREKVVEKACNALSAGYARYWYADSLVTANVTPEDAALELGYRVKPGEGALVLRRIMPTNRVDVILDGRPIEFADPSIAALRRGLSIRRQDWNRVYPYAAFQATRDRKEKVK